MKIITIIAPHISAEALSAAMPVDGVASVTVSETQSFDRTAASVQSYRGAKIPNHFTPVYRVEVAVDDSAAEAVMEGVRFARGAGLLGDARAWISAEAAVDLFDVRRDGAPVRKSGA